MSPSSSGWSNCSAASDSASAYGSVAASSSGSSVSVASALTSAGASVCWCQNCTAGAMNQGNSGEYFSYIQQIGADGFPSAVDSSKIDRFPFTELQHIE